MDTTLAIICLFILLWIVLPAKPLNIKRFATKTPRAKLLSIQRLRRAVVRTRHSDPRKR